MVNHAPTARTHPAASLKRHATATPLYAQASYLRPAIRNAFRARQARENDAMLRGDCAREKNLIERDLQRRKEEMMEIQILNVVRVPECAVEISRAR